MSAHIADPHQHGYHSDCRACKARCHCTGAMKPGDECVWCWARRVRKAVGR